MAEVLRYYRQWQRDPKTLHRIRLGLTVPQVATEGVFNRSSRFGTYARISRRNNNLVYSFSNHGAPPFAHERMITVTGTETEGRFCWVPDLDEARVVYTRGGSVYERRSHSDGRFTWGGESQIRNGATHPDIVCSRAFGDVFYSYYLSGNLYGKRKDPGSASAGSEFTLKDSGGSALLVQDDVHRVAVDTRDTYWLHCRIQGETSTSLWYSTDDGETWEREAGAVTGISSGAFPGIAAGHDGSLLAWAITGGNRISKTYRDAGDTAFGAVGIVADSSGELAVANGSISFTHSLENPDRWILACVVSGDTLPSDLWSSDAGSTVTVLLDH